MEIYNFNEISKVFFCGGMCDDEQYLLKKLQEGMSNGIETLMHPKEIERQERLNKRKIKRGILHRDSLSKAFVNKGNGKYDDSVTFVCGGFGFGTKDDKFFEEILSKVNQLCEKNNSYVVFVRGGNDDPTYFVEDKFNLSHVKLAEDYSVVKLNGFDCLCIGGSLPIDRQWRIEQGERLGKKLFFEGCKTEFKDEILDKILNENKITCIITSDAPTFIPPYIDSSNSSKWAVTDTNIIKDITAQRMTMDKIYGETTKLSKKPYIWCYYAKSDFVDNVNNIRFVSSSSPYVLYNLQNVCEEAFGLTLNGEKQSKSKKGSTLKKMPPPSDYRPDWGTMPRWEVAEPQAELPEIDGGEALGEYAAPANGITTDGRLEEALRNLQNNLANPRNIGENFNNFYVNSVYTEDSPMYGNIVLGNNTAQVTIADATDGAVTQRTIRR